VTAGAGFQVDPARLRSASPQFDRVADQLADARTALDTALRTEGSCWGSDEAGQTFARSYLPQAEATTRALGIVVQELRAIRAGLDASAGTWEGTDQGAAGRFGGHSGRGKQR
jgi:uncharacterized protein YukE